MGKKLKVRVSPMAALTLGGLKTSLASAPTVTGWLVAKARGKRGRRVRARLESILEVDVLDGRDDAECVLKAVWRIKVVIRRICMFIRQMYK